MWGRNRGSFSLKDVKWFQHYFLKRLYFTSNLPWCLCQTSIDCICLVLSGLSLFLCETGESVFVSSLLLGPNSRSWLLLLRYRLFEASAQSSRYFKRCVHSAWARSSQCLSSMGLPVSLPRSGRCSVWPLLGLVGSSLCMCSSVLSHGLTVSPCADFRGLPLVVLFLWYLPHEFQPLL